MPYTFVYSLNYKEFFRIYLRTFILSVKTQLVLFGGSAMVSLLIAYQQELMLGEMFLICLGLYLLENLIAAFGFPLLAKRRVKKVWKKQGYKETEINDKEFIEHNEESIFAIKWKQIYQIKEDNDIFYVYTEYNKMCPLVKSQLNRESVDLIHKKIGKYGLGQRKDKRGF